MSSSFPAARFPTLPLSRREVPADTISEGADAKPSEVSDEALIAQMTTGHSEALAALFERYAQLTRGVAARILRDSAEAEDLVQDLFIFIQRRCAIFDSSKSSARSWIIQMTYHRAIERRRYLSTRHFYSSKDSEWMRNRVVGKPTTTESDYSPEAVLGCNGLSAIYDKSFTELASYFGLRFADLRRDRASIGVPRTHLVDREGDVENQSVSLPVEFKPDFSFEKTNLLSRVVQIWEEVPIGLLQHLDLRKSMYGYIGLEDHTLYPLIRPGSLVQIDPTQRKITSARWRTEFERPIYFIELRDGYLCSWCELNRGQLMVIPHPQSHQAVRYFDHPSQAEVVGRVTGVAMRIVEEEPTEGGPVLRQGL
jgi:RNA polymerase sigma factor (sigma-70 family)